jgi:sterol desaturase/sphingolipid hydroxylase (fatty acid hydroxylase superfamily)
MAGIGGLVVGGALLGLVLWPLERLWPERRQPLLRPEIGTDLAYGFFTPLVTKTVTRVALAGVVLALAAAAGVPLDRAHVVSWVRTPRGFVAGQPATLQVVEVLLLGDLIGYWTHRAFHGRRLWPFHAVHHSSEHLDWLSSVRLHPVNDVASRLVAAFALLLLGFVPGIVAAYVPFLTLYAILLHANVSWSFGRLRFLLTSPAFHRWHHSCEAEGRDRNFAGLFPWIDLAFGTFHMPPGRRPERGGRAAACVPAGRQGQLAYPFRGRARAGIPSRGAAGFSRARAR